jgi:signal transduction histidine kinase
MRGLSIKLKLPLLIGGLVVAVTGVYAVAAYRAMARAAVTVATGRLTTVTDQLAQALHTSRNQLVAHVDSIASRPPIAAYLGRPAASRSAAALAALVPPEERGQSIAGVALWSADRRRLLSQGEAPRRGLAADSTLLQAAAKSDSAVIGLFHLAGDSIAYPVAARVGTSARPLGYVVEWRWVVGTARSREQTNQLVGTNAHIYLGNTGGDIWSDLTRPVAGPPVDVTHATGLLRYDRAGVGPTYAVARHIDGSPWLVLVEYPVQAVLAPARIALSRLALIGVIILVLGLAATWALSRTLTRPLTGLTHAAETVAAGDYAPLVGINPDPRGDELGRLAAAFDTMVQRVAESQQRLEDRVRARTAELQERNEELEAFAYSISHDLRAPLRAMGGFSQALLEDYGDKLDQTGKQYAERVVAGANTMDQLIRDLLAYSRITRSELRLTSLDLHHAMQSATEQVANEVAARHARLVVDEPLPEVVGHETTLAQVLANLLANAIKFVPAERTPDVHVRAERRDGRVRVWVEDNGIGIAPEHHERIFRVFERLNPAEDYPGTGIGLAIVRKGVERMGGRVGVESPPGGGSRFWIDLSQAEAVDERHSHSAG